MTITPDNLLALWTDAHPMHGADLKFASKELRECWRNSLEISAMKTFEEKAISNRDAGRTGWDAFNDAVMASGGIAAERSKVRDMCKKQLLHHVETGALLSIAFNAPRTLNTPPLELAPRVWRGQLKWEQGQITHESLTFVEVRLITAQKVKALLVGKLNTLTNTEQPVSGRPGIKSDIEEAFNTLLQAGNFNINASVKSQCQIIRDWLVEFKPEGGFSSTRPGYDAIRRYISPLIAAIKIGSRKL